MGSLDAKTSQREKPVHLELDHAGGGRGGGLGSGRGSGCGSGRGARGSRQRAAAGSAAGSAVSAVAGAAAGAAAPAPQASPWPAVSFRVAVGVRVMRVGYVQGVILASKIPFGA